MECGRVLRSPVLRVLLAIALVGCASLWPGCSAQKRYSVLNLFFDGVPDPNRPKLRAGEVMVGTEANGAPIIVYTHKPFAEEKCNACHTGGPEAVFRPDVSSVPSTVCIKCHDRVPYEYPVMHGPVATVECLWCHAPHDSAVKHLLKEHSPTICLQCHSREQLPVQPPEHQLAASSCLDCHVAHGATQHGLLRPAPLTTSTTAPAAPPPSGGRT
jgi:predicted CXXCH cytochrome family protein